MSINIRKHTSYNKTNAAANRPLQYIVIHYTAGSTSRSGAAVNTADFWATGPYEGSADFVVDDELIVQYNPDLKNRLCWHCGDGKNYYSKGGSFYGKCSNYNSIGIEICSTNPNYSPNDPANSPKWSFTSVAVDRAVELTKYLMQTYGIDADHVIRHYDVSGKLCPGIIGWNEDSGDVSAWKAFKARLTGASTSSTTATATTTSTDNLYRVRKSWSDSKSQIGAYKSLDSAKSVADKNNGYYVFDGKGNIVYPKTESSYMVKITADVLNVRQGAGTSYPVVNTVKQNEVYTIVEESNGWGLLKAYRKDRNGWISLNYTERK